MEALPLKQIVEGAILAAEQPLTVDQLMVLFEGDIPERSDIREVLKEIGEDCENRGYELKQVASGYRFQVKTEYGEWVSRLWKEKPPRYSRALLETLALVAYKQPLTRGDIEEIRGVAVSTNIMRTLIEREWVRIVGHRDVPGHPALYATTKSFLDYFNIRSLDELPSLAEIRDLTAGMEDLDLEEDLIEMRSLEIDESEAAEVVGLDDADLDAVSEQVNSIQENIRNLYAPDETEADVDPEDEIEPDPGVGVAPAAETEDAAEKEDAAEIHSPAGPDDVSETEALPKAAGEESKDAPSQAQTEETVTSDSTEAPTASVTPISSAFEESSEEDATKNQGSDS